MIPAIAAALEAMGGAEAATASTAMAAGNKAAAESATKASKSLTSMADKLTDVEGKIGSVGAKLGGLSAEFTGTLTLAATSLKSFADPIAELVALANPAPVQQFTLAFRDTLAVVGRALTPVLGALTRGMRTIGDNMARLEPILDSVASVIADTLDGVFQDLNNVWQENGAQIQVLAVVFEDLVRSAGMAVHVVTKLSDTLLSLANPILKLLGFGGVDKKGASSFGAAVRDVRTTTQGEDVSRLAIEKALAAAMGGEPKRDATNLLGELITTANSILTAVGKVPTQKDVEVFLRSIFDRLPKVPEILGGAATGAGGTQAGNAQFGRALISAMLGGH